MNPLPKEMADAHKDKLGGEIEKMKIVLELYGRKYIFESEQNDYNANELKEIFSRLLVQATFSPDVIEPAEGGHFECKYVEED